MASALPLRLCRYVPALAAGSIAAGLYLSTLMLDVSGCGHEYCADTGEFQVALAEWGTVHYTGYPLYMLLGSPFVSALRGLGIPPSAGASAYSLVWEVLAVTGAALIVRRLTGNGWLAFGGGVLLAVIRPVWVHGALAEVYGLSLALAVAILWLTFDLGESWSDRRGWLLAFLVGLGVAHHRLLGLLVLPVGAYLFPAARQSNRWKRWLAMAIPLFLAGFLPYLDMPLRLWRGATWAYGRPDTWDGFWAVFRGTEVEGLQRANMNPAVLAAAVRDVLGLLRVEFTAPGLIAVAVGVGVTLAARRRHPASLLLLGTLATFGLFSVLFRKAVLLEAVWMIPILALVILLTFGASRLPSGWRFPAGLALLGGAALLGVRNYPFVVDLTRDPGGRVYVERVERLEAPSGATVMAPWGGSYFALSYAQRVEGRMASWNVVDHRADFAELAASGDGRIYTASDTLHFLKPEWWEARLGSPLRVTAAGPGLVALTARPLPPPSGVTFPIGDGLALAGWQVRALDSNGRVDVVLYWTADSVVTADYSTFVHLSDRPAIVEPEDLLAGSDFGQAVYGWYPTSRWQPGEVIREDHLLVPTPDRPIRTIVAGMYSRGDAGIFVPLGSVTLRNIDGEWVADTR